MTKLRLKIRYGAVSLIEIIAAMMIAAMIAVAVMTIYNRASSSVNAINIFLDKQGTSQNILQQIVEDIDRIVTPGADAVVKVENKYEDGVSICRFSVESRIYDKDQKPQTFEKVIWQSRYEPDVNSIVLYRARSGMAIEDKIMQQFSTQLTEWKDRELFVPVCSGITHFNIVVPKKSAELQIPANQIDPNVDKNSLSYQKSLLEYDEKWDSESLPNSLRLSISFAPPYKSPTGGWEVADEDIFYRITAVNRIRKIGYKFIPQQIDIPDINDLIDINDVNDLGQTEDVNDSNDL